MNAAAQPTIVGLLHRVHAAAVSIGIDVSARDTAFIVSLFFEGMIDSEKPTPEDAGLQRIADELNTVVDE